MNAGVVTSDKMYYVNSCPGELSAPGRERPESGQFAGRGSG